MSFGDEKRSQNEDPDPPDRRRVDEKALVGLSTSEPDVSLGLDDMNPPPDIRSVSTLAFLMR